MSDDPVTIEALRLENARLEAEVAILRNISNTGPQGPVGPMGPTGPPGPPGGFDAMAAPRHMETMTALNNLSSAVHRIANILEKHLPETDE